MESMRGVRPRAAHCVPRSAMEKSLQNIDRNVVKVLLCREMPTAQGFFYYRIAATFKVGAKCSLGYRMRRTKWDRDIVCIGSAKHKFFFLCFLFLL